MIEIILGIILPLIKFLLNILILKFTFKKKEDMMKGFYLSLLIGFMFLLVSTLLVLLLLEIQIIEFIITLFASYIVFMIVEILFFLRKNKFVSLQS